ncbi:MAG: DUF3750 domain-containing protein [Hyphomicrobiales bacterium]
MKQLTRRLLKLLLVLVILPIVVGATMAYSKGWPANWKVADWSSSGVLPPAAAVPDARVVVLAARTGRWRSIFAEHTAIVLKRAGDPAWTRYDVVGWGDPVRRNHFKPDTMWYGNRPYVVTTFEGETAAQLIPKIEAAIAAYPWRNPGQYTVWPGPNSNTFVAWVARQVPGFAFEMPPTAIGKDWLGSGLHVADAPSGTGWVVSLSGVLGLTVAWKEGLEVNFLGTSIGVDPQDLAINLPSIGKLSLERL